MLEVCGTKLFSPNDLCKDFHMGKQKCLELFRDKDFGAIRIGRRYYVSEENLKKFMSSGKSI